MRDNDRTTEIGEQNWLKRAWAEISLSALNYNVTQIKRFAAGKEMIAVVKANAYGHDVSIVAPALAQCGVRLFAVSNLWEAEDLRALCPDSDILIFGFSDACCFPRFVEKNYIHSVGSVEYAQLLSSFAVRTGERLRVHIKMNTGMHRVGLNTLSDLKTVLQLPGLAPEALYTHFAVADSTLPEDMRFTEQQVSTFARFAAYANLPVHLQNSGGVLYHPQLRADLIRPGVILYGCRPNTSAASPIPLQPVMRLKAVIWQIREIKKGDTVSYGRTFTAQQTMRIAVIPVGYADGYSRALSNAGSVLIQGKLAPIVGRICMDQFMADVSEIAANVGDEVELYSERHSNTHIETIADQLNTIPYEIVCGVGHRVPRVAVQEGKVTRVVRY